MFNGIGGFQLAASWLGWENVFSSEIDEFCNKVTKHHFPYCIQHEDIRTTDFSIYRGRIDVLSGGFPCQPFSTAGGQPGASDERYLFPEMLRAVREIKPRWVVSENVRGITASKFEVVFNEIQASLEDCGYEVFPVLIPASAVGADHERERTWIVAYTKRAGQPESGQLGKSIYPKTFSDRQASWPNHLFQGKSVSHLYEHTHGVSRGVLDLPVLEWRKRSMTGLGNAIVPQVAYEIFKTIEQYESEVV